MLNEVIPTNKGMKLISDLLPGDCIYEYGTSNMIPVLGLQKEYVPLCEVIYSDGRRAIMPEYEAYSEEMQRLLRPVALDYKKDLTQLINYTPDPYVAGALLMYGDLMDECINLPADAKNYSLLLYKYDLEKVETSEKLYFKHKENNDLITYKEFFSTFEFTNPLEILYAPFSQNYIFAHFNARWQFIRGAFDTVYDRTDSPDNINISHTDDFKLRLLQSICHSMGILTSPVEERNDLSWLHVIRNFESYPGMIYEVENIAQMIDVDWHVYKYDPHFEWKIVKINHLQPDYRFKIFPTKRKYFQYYGESFLPRML